MDRSLATLLRSLQSSRSYEEAQRLLPTATSLLTQLSNPLNLTLLASQLLATDLLFPRPTELTNCRRIFNIFYTAAVHVVQDRGAEDQFVKHLSPDVWTKAVTRGADDKSPRWRHLLLLGGILLGLEVHQQHLSSNLRRKLEQALVTASNLALEQANDQEAGASYCVVFVLNHTFSLLSDFHRAQIQYNRFLPLAVDATFFSSEGLAHGYWVGIIDSDVKETNDKKFSWSSTSPTFRRAQEMRSNILVSNFGLVARLIAHAIENVQDHRLVTGFVDRLLGFATTLAKAWRQNKLSEVEMAEEFEYLDQQTLKITLPLLFQILRDALLAIIVLLRAVMGRLLIDPILAADAVAPGLASNSLVVLQNLQFIASRFGQTSSSQYVFVNFTAIDVLSQHPRMTERFLEGIRPLSVGEVSPWPLDRAFDLFFLNTAEHLTHVVSQAVNENLILASALPYASPDSIGSNTELYEASHSVMLAVFASKSCADLASRQLPFYTESLMQSFPKRLSPRQFCLAIKSVSRIAGHPSEVASQQPLLQPILMEMLIERTVTASDEVIPNEQTDNHFSPSPDVLSEKSSLVLALIDSLPFLPVPALLDLLPRIAEAINKISEGPQRNQCHQRFWEALSGGEMDVERAAACVTWWTSRGGRELLLFGDQVDDDEDYMMTGAVYQDGKQ